MAKSKKHNISFPTSPLPINSSGYSGYSGYSGKDTSASLPEYSFVQLPVFEQVNSLRQKLAYRLQKLTQLSIMIYENFDMVNVRFTMHYPEGKLYGLEIVLASQEIYQTDMTEMVECLSSKVEAAVKDIKVS